ncbi:MAG TPA: Hsp20 family protein [Stellaceae bacterium]
MPRLSLFNSPLLLGFDQFERALDRVSKTAVDGYPPYNVEQTGDNALRITLAVAGFAADDLAVQVEDRQLVVRGKHTDERERVYLHRGIAARQFQRSFVLAEGIEVLNAALDNGLLHIDLVRHVPEGQVRTIAIATARARPQPIDTNSGPILGAPANGTGSRGGTTGLDANGQSKGGADGTDRKG